MVISPKFSLLAHTFQILSTVNHLLEVKVTGYYFEFVTVMYCVILDFLLLFFLFVFEKFIMEVRKLKNYVYQENIG